MSGKRRRDAARVIRPGPRNLITDVSGLRVGNASDPWLKSGVTVLTADAPFVAAVDIRGGAPGTRETELLAPGRLVNDVDALVLSGGSAFGLDAASGVADALRARGRGYPVAEARVPIVPAAILFDLLNGGDKVWETNPYRALGVAALDAAAEDFAIGTAGAGTGAATATWKGGLGSASYVLESGATVGALVAVNPIGGVTAPASRHFLAATYEVGDEFGGLGPPSGPLPAFAPEMLKGGEPEAGTSTTIAIVATDITLDKSEARRLAEMAHDGMARAIYPSHTPFDGDLVFAVSTDGRPAGADAAILGHLASLCLARAIARAVFAARTEPGDLFPAWSQSAG